MVNGQLDISLFPLDYASGKVPTFSATLMPGLIRNQDRAKRINDSPFMNDPRRDRETASSCCRTPGLRAAWRRRECILLPEDLKGMKFRAAGPTFAAMWEAAGASIVSPPSNEIYNAFQTGVVTATDTSLGTFASTRLYEVTDCLTAPGNNALWFMYEPVLMSKKSFDRLNKPQQDAVIKAGKDAQAYYEGKADAVNTEAIKAFEDHKVKVVTLSDAEYNAWLDAGQEKLIRQIRQGRAQRPKADRRGAGGQIESDSRSTAGGRCSRPHLTAARAARPATPAIKKSELWTLTSGPSPPFATSRACRRFPDRLAVFVICDMVIERYFLDRTTIWQIDVVTYSIVAATFVGSAYVLMTRGHVNVDVLPLHRRARRATGWRCSRCLFALGFCVVLFVLCTLYWYQAWSKDWHSDTVWRARLWIPYLSMPVGLGLLVLQYLVELICLVTGRAPPFGSARIRDPAHEPDRRRSVVLVLTLLILLSGMPVAFGLGASRLFFC